LNLQKINNWFFWSMMGSFALLAHLLLLTIPYTKVLGIKVTPADCFIEPAIERTYKIIKKFDCWHIPIGQNDFNVVNAFPNEYRPRPQILNTLPELINVDYPLMPYALSKAIELLDRLVHTA